jgi:hypothetical protein
MARTPVVGEDGDVRSSEMIENLDIRPSKAETVDARSDMKVLLW